MRNIGTQTDRIPIETGADSIGADSPESIHPVKPIAEPISEP